MRPGDPVPNENATFYTVTNYSMLGAGGHVLFAADWIDEASNSRSGLFRRDPSGAILEIARRGDVILTIFGDREVPSLTYGPGILARDGAVVYSRTDEPTWARTPGGPFEILVEPGMPCPNDPESLVYTYGNALHTQSGRVNFFVDSCGGTQIWAGPRGSIAPVARAQDPVSGWNASPPATISSLYLNPGLQNDAGELYFVAPVLCENDPECPGSAGMGLFRTSGGALTTVARASDPAPGLTDGSLLGEMVLLGVSNGGHALVEARLHSSPGTPNGRRAIYVFDASGAGTLVARTGDPVPGIPNATWTSLTLNAPSQQVFAWIANDGTVVFYAEISDPGMFNLGRFGIWKKDGVTGDLRLVARGGEPAPGGTVVFEYLGIPVVSPTGRVAFIGNLLGNEDALFVEDVAGNLVRAGATGDSVDVGSGAPFVLGTLRVGFDAPTGTGSDGRFMFFSESGELLLQSNGPPGDTGLLLVRVDGAPKEVDIVGIEVVQVAQDWANSVPLVANKTTFVRVHAEAPEPTIVRTRIRARRNGQELPGSPFEGTTFGQLSVAEPDAQPHRAQLGGAMYFELPPEWTRPGELEIEVERHPRAGELELRCRDRAGTADDCKVTVRFDEMPPLDVVFVRLGGYARELSTSLFHPKRDVRRLVAEIENVYPVTKVRSSHWEISKTLPDDRTASKVIRDFWMTTAQAAKTDLRCGDDCPTIIYGYYPVPPLDIGGLAEGIPGKVAIGSVWFSGWNRYTQLHEIGHLLGRPHAVHSSFPTTPLGSKRGPCGEVAAPNAPDWPYLFEVDGRKVATLGPLDDPERIVYGLDTSIPRVIDPREHFELMSYCDAIGHPNNAAWISGVTYTAIKDAITTRFPMMPGETLPAIARKRLIAELEEQRARVLPVETSVPPPASGTWSLSLRDAAGVEVHRTPFDPIVPELRPPLIEDDEPIGTLLDVLFPEDVAFASLAVIDAEGNERIVLTASPNPPALELIEPLGNEPIDGDVVTVSWTADDPDGDDLTFNVSYSADGGTSWRTLAVDLVDTSIEIPRTAFVGSTQGILRVDATDGVNVASVRTQTPLVVVGQPPLAMIRRPLDGTLAVAADPIFLDGRAEDDEDGELSGDALEWISDRDGLLGRGSTIALSAADLSEGDHTITLRATDSDGMIGEEQVGLRIRRTAPAAFADVALSGTLLPNPVAPDGSLVVEFVASNAGPDEAADVALTIEVPAEIEVVDAVASAGSCNRAGGTVDCALGALARGASANVRIDAAPRTSGIYAITAMLTERDADPIAGNDRIELALLVDERGASGPPDAGVPDATIGVDASSGDPDAGTAIDAGTSAEEEGGCSCRANAPARGGSIELALILLALAFTCRRSAASPPRSAASRGAGARPSRR